MRSRLIIKASDGVSAVFIVKDGSAANRRKMEWGHSTAYSVHFDLLFIRFRSRRSEKAIDGRKVLDMLCAKGS